MREYLILYLILTCPEPICVQFPTSLTHEEAGDTVLDDEGACPSSSQDSTDRSNSLGSRCHSLDDEAAVRQDDGYPRPDGYEPDDEKLRPHGVHFADQGRSRESSPEGYPWPLSLAAETADPATLRSILVLKKSSAKDSSSTSHAGVSS